jgi:hypothetical protein
MKRRLLFTLALVMTCLVPARKAAAQDYVCGMRCETSCTVAEVGGMHATDGTSNPLAMHYSMECWAGSTCDICRETRRGGDDDALATALASVPTDKLKAMARASHKRILVSVSRNLVVIRGSECSPDAFVAVTTVSNARARQLVQLGIAELEKVTPPAGARRAN